MEKQRKNKEKIFNNTFEDYVFRGFLLTAFIRGFTSPVTPAIRRRLPSTLRRLRTHKTFTIIYYFLTGPTIASSFFWACGERTDYIPLTDFCLTVNVRNRLPLPPLR